jgi:hypothetical protein
MVGLLPLCATTVIEPWQRERVPRAAKVMADRVQRMPELLQSIHPTGPDHHGYAGRGIAALVNPEKLRRILSRMLDEKEFFSPYGIRALSKFHEEHPFVFYVRGQEYRVNYLPAESDTGMFGGNSNWRGPLWFPLNYLICSSLERYHRFFGDDLTFEYPVGSGHRLPLGAIVADLQERMVSLFVAGPDGRRPCFGWVERLQNDPAWKDNLMFSEYFHGDNGAGIGASHQTGWTGVIADVIRRRHGAVRAVGDVVRDLRPETQP